MKKSARSLLVSALAASCAWLSLNAAAAVVYMNDFQGAVGSEWSSTSTSQTPTPYVINGQNVARQFLGEFGNQSVSLTLAGLPVHNQVTLDFDLYLIRSWDGNSGGATRDAWGNDYFGVNVLGGPALLYETFSNGNPAGQSFGGQDKAGGQYDSMAGSAERYSLGYGFYDGIYTRYDNMDSAYHFSFRFADSGNSLSLNFLGSGLQEITDESWGLDNVAVGVLSTANTVSEPSALMLLVSGAAAMLVRRRNFLAQYRN